MTFQTLEVDWEDGLVRPRGLEVLPSKARALLTIVEGTSENAEESLPSLAERLRHFKGIGQGKYTDLSTNKSHLDDLGL
jgi:hypothetical protein